MKRQKISQPRSFIPYGDAIRVVGAFMVVAVHALNNYFAPSCCGGNWWFYAVVKALGLTAIPLFFMLSGAIFLQTPDTPSLTSFYWKRWQRLWGAVIGWGTIYAVWSWYHGWFHGVELYLKQGMYYHFYFLFAICWLYILTPLLRRLFLPKNYVSLYFVFSGSLLAGIFHWLFMFETSPHPLANIHFYVGAIFYYLLGGVISKVSTNPSAELLTFVKRHSLQEWSRYLALGLVASLGLTTILSVWWGHTRGIHGSGTFPSVSVFQPFQAITALCLYGFIAITHSIFSIWNRFPKVVHFLSEASIHCYLGHIIIMEVLAPYTIPWKTGHFGPFFIIIEALFVFALFNTGYWLINWLFSQLTAGIFTKLRYNKLLAKQVNN